VDVRGLAAVLLLLALARAGDEVVAELGWAEWQAHRYPYGRLALREEVPEGVEPPAGEDLELLWGHFGFAEDKKLLLAVDFGEDGPRLWLDANFDGKLTEEPVVMRRGGARRIPQATVELALPDRKVLYCVCRYRNDPKGVVHLAALAHRAGTVVLEGRLRRLTVVDNNGNQRFDEQGTRCRVDLDGDGQAAGSEWVEIGQPFRLRDRGYVLAVLGRTARRVAFRPAAGTPPPRSSGWRRRNPPRPGRGAPGKMLPGGFKAHYAKAAESDTKFIGGYTYARRSVLRLVGETGAKGAAPFLYGRFRTERDKTLKVAALKAMGYLQYAAYAPKVAAIARTSTDAETAKRPTRSS
jgi:hypothetical protein